MIQQPPLPNAYAGLLEIALVVLAGAVVVTLIVLTLTAFMNWQRRRAHRKLWAERRAR